MKWVANIIISLGAVALLSTGIYLAVIDRTTTATAILGFAFLFIVLLLLAKFKHIKGFGFEAEMWEEKQEEAALLVDRLTVLSATVSQQMALIAAKLGLWDSGLTFQETAKLLEQIRNLLAAAKVPVDEMNRILAPLYDRIEMNYWFAAQNLLARAMATEMEAIQVLPSSEDTEARQSMPQRMNDLTHDQILLGDIPYREFQKDRSLGALVAFGNNSRSLAQSKETLRTLDELHLDLEHFKAHRKFRRDTDLSYLLHTPNRPGDS